MSTSKKASIRIIAISIILISLLVGVWYNFNRGVADTHKIPTVANLTVSQFMKQFDSNDSDELVQYIDQAIEVRGLIKEVSERNGVTTILLQDKEYEHLVMCELQKGSFDTRILPKEGQEIKLKGIYKGALMDVILLNCIILDVITYD